jgi:hypothetical protein
MASVAGMAASGTSTSILDVLSKQDIAPGWISEKLYANAPWMDLANTAVMSKLLPGDVIKFKTLDGSHDFSHSEANSLPVFQQIDVGSFCAQLCGARELGLKIDNELIKGHEADYMTAFNLALDNSLTRLNQNYFKQLVNQMLTGAAAINQGNNAGANGGGLKLGTVGAPLVINVAPGTAPEATYRSILDVVINLMSVRSQANMDDSTENWKLLVHDELVLNFSYAQSMQNCCDISKSVIMSGVRTYGDLFGQTAVVSQLMPKIPTATGFKTPIILTSASANAFWGGISSAYRDEEFATSRIILKETRGGVTLMPSRIYVAWVELKRS